MKGGGGKAVVVIVVLVLLVLGAAAAHIRDRAAAKTAADRYVSAVVSIYSPSPKLDELRAVLCGDDIQFVDEREAWINKIAAEGGEQIALKMQHEYDMGSASVGLKRAEVKVRLTTTISAGSKTKGVTVHMVRQGLAWKVEYDETSDVGGIGFGLGY